MRDRFNMFSPRPKTAAERMADLERLLDAASKSARQANEENMRLRRLLDEADRRRREAELMARQADSRRLDAVRELEALRLGKCELQARLEGMLALRGKK